MADYGSAKRSRGASPTSRMTDNEPTFLEMRTSLLQMAEESMGERKHQLHRLMCISKIKPEVSNKNIGRLLEYKQTTDECNRSPAFVDLFFFENLAADIEKTMKELEALRPDEVTGLLLIFPQHCVHIVEGSTDTLVSYLRGLKKREEDDGCLLVSKVLNVAHDIQTILLQNWMSHIFDIQATGIGDYESNEPTQNLVIDMVVNTLKLALFLSKQPKLSYNSAVQALHERVPELLPQQDILEYFLEKPDTAIQTVSEFLKVYYDDPYPVKLQGETVWPMPDHLMPSFAG